METTAENPPTNKGLTVVISIMVNLPSLFYFLIITEI